jgi:hypothetical protein
VAIIFSPAIPRPPQPLHRVSCRPLQPFARYSSRSCISRSRAATAVLTPDSESPSATTRAPRTGPPVCAPGPYLMGDAGATSARVSISSSAMHEAVSHACRRHPRPTPCRRWCPRVPPPGQCAHHHWCGRAMSPYYGCRPASRPRSCSTWPSRPQWSGPIRPPPRRPTPQESTRAVDLVSSSHPPRTYPPVPWWPADLAVPHPPGLGMSAHSRERAALSLSRH